jgi:5-methylcytosine-specific restriction endonuclease McrA
MPWRPAEYPHEWPAIRAAILARAQHRCEGCPHFPDCRAVNHVPHPVTGSVVVLTIAHLCECLPKCGIPAHLRALCQRCHLRTDLVLHQRHAAETRRHAKEALGQLTFLR